MTGIVEELSSSRAAYLDSLAGADEEEARWREGADRWSILECAEHVANVEFRLLRTIQKAPAIPPSEPNPEREQMILEKTISRANPIPAPELVRPTGRYGSLAEAAEAFENTRNTAIAFLRGFEGNLRAIGATHPILGPCNGYEYVLIMIAHPVRHAGQIREIREAYRAR